MNNCKAVVVIPIHSPSPSQEELLALAQCYKILSNHDVFILHPKGLCLKEYQAVISDVKALPIHPEWLSSVENYNRLKTSLFFYSLFSVYDYLLTYELDAYVFKDDLEKWCKKGYSYIGAPWFNGATNPLQPFEIIGVGNSGFSLRSIKKCMAILKRIETIRSLSKLYSKAGLGELCAFTSFLRVSNLNEGFKIRDYTYLTHLIDSYFTNEDVFWSVWITCTFYDFKLAPVLDAIDFSFEVKPSLLFEKNDKRLPFGCHAWMKYDPEFWHSFLNQHHLNDFTSS